jgi:lipoyl(octanoyl) transferase
MQQFNFQVLGVQAYQKVWDLQKELVQKVTHEGHQNTILLCEHLPVYTFGKSANRENLLVTDDKLKEIQAEVFEIERGGDITFHGPGQLVGYPILHLHKLNMGVKKYVWSLEEALIRTLRIFGIETKRIDSLTGIWLSNGEERKIAAIGIKVSRGVTMHGFALNVNTDLTYFDYMVPCGIEDKDVTSMELELGGKCNMSEVVNEFKNQFTSVFSLI